MKTSHHPAYKLSALAIAVIFAASCGGSGSVPISVSGDFTAYGVKGTVSGQNVSLDLSGLGNCSTTVKNMVIGINANGASISPDPRVARDYSQPVQFTLTAPDGTKVVYTVTVTGAACLNSPTPTPPPIPCTAAPVLASEPYSLVFKGCSVANVAEYYAKDECVRQNSTGLIWQGQMPAGSGHLRANDQYKTNLDSTTALQIWKGTASGTGGAFDLLLDFIAPTDIEVNASSNSIGYKKDVNDSNLCGSGAWRLPTKVELQGIVKTTEAPTIDNLWFPNTQYRGYWTSSPHAGYDHGAWYVDFTNGADNDAAYRDNNGVYGNYNLVIRLVR